MPDAHNRTRYLAGCRCDVCKEAQAAYRRDLRIRKTEEAAGGQPVSSVKSAPKGPTVWEPGAVTKGVEAELEGYVGAEKRPGLAATALALAAVLDNRAIASQHPAAARQLTDILDALGRQGTKRKSKVDEARRQFHAIDGGAERTA